MKNSPDKYGEAYNRSTQHSCSPRNDKFREVSFERSFDKKHYHVEGCVRSNRVDILVVNNDDPRERHDISLPLQDGVRLIDEHFRSDFRRMLMAVEWDSENKQFCIRLP